MIALIPILVAVLGILLWALAQNAIVKESGKILFFCGVLVALFVFGTKWVHVP